MYSDNPNTRQAVMLALGKRVHPDLPELSYVEVATGPVVVQQLDAGGIDLAILDGEATPEGGMGLAKQLKDEIDDGPPIVVLTGRRDDAWLATWSRAEGAVPHPIDPIRLSRTVLELLRTPVAVAVSTCPGSTHRPSLARAETRLHERLMNESKCSRILGNSRYSLQWLDAACPVAPTARQAVVEVTSNLLSAGPHAVARLWLRSQSSP